ncbi:MAG: hypothetical protein BroJett018_20520 [Chloroflexota bacterium]|nr:MAG: hypothetical protein BroJett018_20520 [Chloroflexota bacterium]
MIVMTQSLSDLVRPSPRFQRAIHLRYDLGDPHAVERYIVTPSAVDAIASISQNTQPDRTQRAHLLYAAYGSGKSLLAVVLAALLEKNPRISNILHGFAEKVEAVDARASNLLMEYLNGETRLLPVVLSGDEGDFATAMSRALSRALKDAEVHTVKIQTRYEDALSVIEQWEQLFPDTLTRFEEVLHKQYDANLHELSTALKAHDGAAFETFETIYSLMTAGVQFNQFNYQTPELIFQDVAAQLSVYGYSGIVVLWDEFGRYLEGRTAQVFGKEAELLQSFAETCNYSGKVQLHFLAFAHKELQSYASALPKTYQQEWSRIEGRFQRHNISGDPYIAYRLIGNSIEHVNPETVRSLLPPQMINQLVSQTVDSHLFGILPTEDVRSLIHQVYPLHPLTVFCLARLSNRVAQNERTMFTFLTTDEPKALHGLLRHIELDKEDYFIRPIALWDYFEDAIRSDAGVGGTHRTWSGVIQALEKVADTDELGRMLVKTLGVLSISADSNAARPTTDLLCWAVGAETDEQQSAVVVTLENLRRRKVIINRQIDGYWTFTIGSDIDFERYLDETLERTNPTSSQLRRLLEKELPAPYTLARRYNQERSMTRYFNGIYRWSDELTDSAWDIQIKKLDNADGLVVYVLAGDDLALGEAREAIKPHPRVIYVLPDKPLVALHDLLRELFGLHELNNDPHLKQQDDPQRIQLEMDWLLEDASARLRREIESLIEPRRGAATWFFKHGSQLEQKHVSTPGGATKLVSNLCTLVFPKTPIFNSEGLNKRYPTGQQMNAAEKVIDAIFAQETSDATFGLTGNGPEVVAFKTFLQMTGVLQPVDEGIYRIGQPDSEQNPYLFEIWGIIEDYFDMCMNTSQSFAKLTDVLTAEPYGLRFGVLPILLGAVLKARLKVTTIRKEGKSIYPLTGKLIIEAISEPDQHTLELGEWDKKLDQLWRALNGRFASYIHETERSQQPITMLRLSLTRWLQSLPSFCRDTQKLSEPALTFRAAIRQLQTEPAQILFAKLPELLSLYDEITQEEIEQRLDTLIAEISNAYLELQRRLDVFVIEEFTLSGSGSDGQTVLKTWLHDIQARRNKNLKELRFGSTMTQQFVNTIARANGVPGQFWDDISQSVTGLHLRDWNDKSEEKFYSTLRNCRTDVEREVEELLQEEAVVAISVQLSGRESDFRFRASELSQQGKRLLQNFKSQMEISGRPLSVDERRQIAVAFLYHMMGEEISE